MIRSISPILVITMVIASLLLISNSSGVPQAVTKAPGEANHNSCATCHTPAGNFVPSITLDVMKLDSTIVKSYEPGATYIVRVKVSATNSPKAFGFQMACLDSLTNTDQGIWTMMGPNVKQQNLTVLQKPRKYLSHSSPRTNGVFTARWTAPPTDIGKVKFYYTGLAINLNNNTNGDNNIFGQQTLSSPSTTAAEDQQELSLRIYPNPATDRIYVQDNLQNDFEAVSVASGITYKLLVQNGSIDLSNLPSGIYLLRTRKADGSFRTIQKIAKL